jgi:hypothetical protein
MMNPGEYSIHHPDLLSENQIAFLKYADPSVDHGDSGSSKIMNEL